MRVVCDMSLLLVCVDRHLDLAEAWLRDVRILHRLHS
jgi:hypothetical protein